MDINKERPMKKLSKLCSGMRNVFVKKQVLLGYTSDKLSNYLKDYCISVAKVDGTECSKEIKEAINKYQDITDNMYCVFEFNLTVNPNCRFTVSSPHVTTNIAIHEFSCYDDAYDFINEQIKSTNADIKSNEYIMFVMVYKNNEEVCEAVHHEIFELVSNSRVAVSFKSQPFSVKLFLRIDRDMSATIDEDIARLNKLNTSTRSHVTVAYASRNQPMVITLRDYKLLNRIKLIHPWVFKCVFKINYGIGAVKQKIEDNNV